MHLSLFDFLIIESVCDFRDVGKWLFLCLYMSYRTVHAHSAINSLFVFLNIYVIYYIF